MWFPMTVLAIGSVSTGFLFTQGDALKKWLSPLFPEHGEHTELLKPIVVTGLALTMIAIGVAIALFKYQFKEVSKQTPEDVSFLTRFVRRDLGQDSFNEAVFMRPGQSLTSALVKVDESVVDGAVRGVGSMALGSGSVLRQIQTGFARSYAALILIGAVVLIAAIWVITT
jgi:NADH-quinone oxidoreductase subunit L